MAQATITSPNPTFSGVSAGVRFSDGKAVIELPRKQAALEYFQRQGFSIAVDETAAEPEVEAPSTEPEVKTTKGKGKAAETAGDGPTGPQTTPVDAGI